MDESFATYSPEDNKLRLYIGRVPRDEYLSLKAEGWKPLYKQREAGGGDFVATWTPERRDRALTYSDIIYDEDMGPEERAVDRAERFAGYRDKRAEEAIGKAESYESQPAAHGFQSEKKAERAAARHDRIGDRAVDAWDKAEYWTRRTAAVISHALYKSSPAVRMGRIKTIEADLRKRQAARKEWKERWLGWKKIAELTDPAEQTRQARIYSGFGYDWTKYQHPDGGEEDRLYYLLSGSEHRNIRPITGAEAVGLFFEKYPNEPKPEDDWTRHYELRLAYENQMLEAQGGRAAMVEMEVGGWIGNHQIRKINKSHATGRVVSVQILAPSRYSADGKEYLRNLNIERLATDAYRPPTDEERKAFLEKRAAEKSAAPKKDACPLINPSDEEAQRLQDIWNDHAQRNWEKNSRDRHYSNSPPEKSEVCRMTQAQYSARSKGTYASVSTRGIFRGGRGLSSYYRDAEKERDQLGKEVAQVRRTSGSTGQSYYTADRVIILTDKPSKPFPSAVWETVEQPQPTAILESTPA